VSITLKNQSALSQDEEADLLISALHAWGIDYLIAHTQNAIMKRAASRLAPAQWAAHAKYVGRYGKVDVFYFDLYSLALSKISRGSDRDLVDVRLLVQQKLIMLDELDAAYQEVLPRMGKRPYINLNPQRFAERYEIVRQQLQQIS